ncbi:hypothetical protein DBV05_g11584 [Lasiodiplodia theobromae]|uniref:Uncharacterized protein n=1 Tax=Lasiodiplodia theobromae TaxID=45133 RepID=A0A5N5CWJ8_9PEZI|nr:hypothetical protein DBV05_g11584 [Lasiodiplodia theobromae]
MGDPLGHDPNNVRDDQAEASATTSDSLTNHESDNATFGTTQSSKENSISQRESSEFSTIVSEEDNVDDLVRMIDIIKPGDHERTYRARMLIDSGNPHENLISSRRALNKLAPWTRAAIAAKNQTRGQLRNIDGTIIDRQDGTVKISWYGMNRSGLHNPIVYFHPIRYETTHVVMDADSYGADIILSWKEVKSLKLRHRFTGAIQRPPTPKNDPGDKKYQDYEQRRADKKAARDEKRGNSESQPSGAGKTSQTGQ